MSVILTPGRVGTNTSWSSAASPMDVRSVSLRWSHELTEGGALPMEAVAGADRLDGVRARCRWPAPGR